MEAKKHNLNSQNKRQGRLQFHKNGKFDSLTAGQ